jgi:hypothetical protein
MQTMRPALPKLTVNRQFRATFLAEQTPCLALGLVEEGSDPCALIALRLDEALPRAVSAAGFRFGNAILGTGRWEVVHFAFEFYGFATYNVLVNPGDPVVRSVLTTMVETGDYFFFALDSDRQATAFRSGLGNANLAGLKANLSRLQRSATTDAQYRQAVSQFERHPDPPGTLLRWVCRDSVDSLDPAQDPLVMNPA